MRKFKVASVMTGAITLVFFVILLFVPAVVFWLFQIEGNDSAEIIARRAALLLLGIAVLSLAGRDAPHSALRQAVCLGLASTMLGLAGLGTLEFLRSRVGAGVFPAVAAETFLGILYVRVWLENRRLSAP